MKSLIIISLALLLGGGLMLVADIEPGFVLLQYGRWSLESTLIVFMVGFIILLVASYTVLRSWIVLRQTPEKMAAWRAAQRQRMAAHALTRGLITLEEGRWSEAERLLVRHASNSDTPLLHYLAAARSAQKQGASDRRDNYLRLAHETTEGADVAVGVVQAELQLMAGQKELALATLQHLREVSPKHPYVLQLLNQLYLDTNQWKSVQQVLPDLRKRKVVGATEAKALNHDAATGQLHSALLKHDWPQMNEVWLQLSNKDRREEALLTPYISGLIEQGELVQAIELIEAYLNKNWSDALVHQYGKILHGDLLRRLAKAEKWLDGQEDNSWLLLTLGRLALANKLWANAENYLRSSIKFGPRGETYQVLAAVMTSEGKHDVATELYKQGLEMMLESPELTVPAK